MRRWTASDGVPPATTAQRIDTTVPVLRNGQWVAQFTDQSDDTPKPLRLKRFSLWDGLVVSPRARGIREVRWAPHPVLCSPWGAIDILPDHMHEGLVREDADVDLSGSYSVDGATRAEFPSSGQHRPQVVAWATVRGGSVVYNDLGSSTVDSRVVPSVAVYDGEPVNRGRIVVDATWHNWIDINVRGVGAGGATGLLGRHLELVQTYYRNIAQWLARPGVREWMRDGLLLHVVANTGGWVELLPSAYLGEMATDVLGRRSSECTRRGWLFEPWWYEIRWSVLAKEKLAVLLPPEELLHDYVLGSLAGRALEIARDLPRGDGTDEPPQEDTPKEFAALSAALTAARAEGVRSFLVDVRDSLAGTERLLAEMDTALDRSGKARPRRRASSPSPAKPARGARRSGKGTA
jgi:hypothetical protein